MRARTLTVACVAAAATALPAAPAAPATAPPTVHHAPEAPPELPPVVAVARVAPAPTGPLVDTIGVVSFNAFHDLTPKQAWRDVKRLTGRPGVDVIGFQEGEDFGRMYRRRLAARGFEVVVPSGGAKQVPVAFRASVFTLVSVTRHKAHESSRHMTGVVYKFPSRWTLEVVLRHTASGRLLTVLNSHVNHKTEAYELGRPGRVRRDGNAETARQHLRMLRRLWNSRSTAWTVGTADLNFDFVADQRVRARGMPARAFAGRAVSNWEMLGVPSRPTHVPADPAKRAFDRWIDYVFLAAGDVGVDARFVAQRVLGGYASDHRPVLARLELYGAEPAGRAWRGGVTGKPRPGVALLAPGQH